MKKAVHVTLALGIIVSLVLSGFAYKEKQWETLTASLSLIIAIISSWIAYETFNKQNEEELPQLILSFDLKSRYGFIQLVINNYGGKPAFNIIIDWNEPLINSKGEKIRFCKSDKLKSDIPVLNKNERVAILVNGTYIFYEQLKVHDLSYTGQISYTLSITSKKRYYQPFYITLESYKRTLEPELEEGKTHYELQKLPSIFIKIHNELKAIKEEISKR